FSVFTPRMVSWHRRTYLHCGVLALSYYGVLLLDGVPETIAIRAGCHRPCGNCWGTAAVLDPVGSTLSVFALCSGLETPIESVGNLWSNLLS
ncbi:hypothetical protein NPN16_23730, partial [Vibrio parahaemolyticus]|uniref:hypothetical protein n=1 Tax=Vibrio parahaemolyticus TaxID=670 RepID=UPI00211314E3